MPISASSVVFRTSRTFKVVAPSLRTVCQSLPPSSTSPASRSPSNEPPGTTPMRRKAPGVAPTICSLRTSRRITNSGRVRTLLRTSGRSPFRLVDMVLASRSSPRRRFLVLDEIPRHVRPPAIERVFRVPVARFPRRVFGNVVDVVEILGVAAPGIPDVVEDVAADGVAPQPPGRLPAAFAHPHPAHADLVEAAHLVGGVVEAPMARLPARQRVVIGRAAQERQYARHPVRDLEAEYARVEALRRHRVRREEQHMA